jgi:hypothetical protein
MGAKFQLFSVFSPFLVSLLRGGGPKGFYLPPLHNVPKSHHEKDPLGLITPQLCT